MPNCKSMFAFAGTKEQADKMTAAIDKHRDQKGALMPYCRGTGNMGICQEVLIRISRK